MPQNEPRKPRRVLKALVSLGPVFWTYFFVIQLCFVIFFVALFLGSLAVMGISLVAANVLFFVLLKNTLDGDYY